MPTSGRHGMARAFCFLALLLNLGSQIYNLFYGSDSQLASDNNLLLQDHPESELLTLKTTTTNNRQVCGSVESADAALIHLNRTEGRKLERLNPLCPSATFNKIHVVIPYHSLPQTTIERAVQSVQMQQYPQDRIEIWLYEDGMSSNNDTDYSFCQGNKPHIFTPLPLSSFESTSESNSSQLKLHVHQQFENGVNFLDNNTVKTAKNNKVNGTTQVLPAHCILSDVRLGPAGSKFWVFQIVKLMAATGPNDVFLVLDGDDELLQPQSLEIVNQKYLDTNAWFTYGSMEGKWSEQINDLPKQIKSGQKAFLPRHQTWLYGHPRTFKAHLLQHIPISDFLFSDGQWLEKGTERGFVFRMLEVAGIHRIGYIPDKIYKYNYSPTFSTVVTLPAKVQTAHTLHSTNGMIPTMGPLLLPLHIVLTVWMRTFMLNDQLTYLQQQTGLNGRVIHVHLVNNNKEEHTAIDTMLQDFKKWQTTKFVNQALHILVTLVDMHDFDSNKLHHNFARFVYTEHLRKTTPIDEVILLDDDQYWPPTFLSFLLESHKPKGMTTWYGKSWKQGKPRLGSLANYWMPHLLQQDLIKAVDWPEANLFKYGGAGGSIYDTNLWLLDAQLQRPANDLSKWARIDDLWASYVLDALLGWEIRRLTPDHVPLDVGSYQDRGLHFGAVFVKFDVPTQHMLDHKYMSARSPQMSAVATWTDPTVDKQEMFSELQTKFMWDAFDPQDLQSATLDAQLFWIWLQFPHCPQ